MSLHSHYAQDWLYELSLVLLILDILTGTGWNLKIVLICVSLMFRDLEGLFNCFSAIWVSSIKNSPFRFVSHFLLGLFSFLISKFLSSLHIFLILNLYQKWSWHFPHSVVWQFVYLTVFFAYRSFSVS